MAGRRRSGRPTSLVGMSPSQEVLNSIENRLRELELEIAALESARAELTDEEWVARRAAELAAQSRAAAV